MHPAGPDRIIIIEKQLFMVGDMRGPRWDDLRTFLEVAEQGSLSAAAAVMGSSAATLGRRIDALETVFGFRLMRRGPNGVTLTQDGARVLELVRAGADRFGELDRLARHLVQDAMRPPIRISSTEPMVADVLAPELPRLQDAHPEVRVELESSLELSSLNRGEADMAIRMVRPVGETLVTRRLTPIRMGLFATAAYLAGRSRPLDLAEARLLWYDAAYGDIAENVWLRKSGLESRVVMRSGSVRALLQAALAGVGVAPLPVFLATRHKLVKASDQGPPTRTPWLVFHRDTRNDKTMKAVRKWVADACRSVIADASG